MTQSSKPVIIWMMAMAVMIFIMIAIGGYTRLSGSGLSMVKWKPVTGWFPPLNDMEWNQEFQHYQASPEFLKVNAHMNLSDFKGIFWAEFIHRVFGRVLGLVFFIPFLLFCWKGVLPPKQRWIYLGIGLLGGAQGVLGWWMVKSGLVDRPEVSAYRLCAHLMLASLLFWMCLLRVLIEGQTKWATSKLHLCCIFILFLQLSSGAFASGTEAGHVFFVVLTSFGAHVWLPELGIQNVFDNIFVIMFHHLSLAIVLTTFLLHYSYREWKRNNKTVIWIVLALGLQISLGLLTAWHYSPTRPLWLALSHQLGAFLLLTSLTLCAPKRDLSALG